ncbi:MAG: hypothetical protein EB036_04970 [Betaproteobacteria bacterium]|nr:hypothetical protein [Betaproteobacteria bacterium]NDE92712.1 hypothetical protein [Betaproteobacteria bacterium]
MHKPPTSSPQEERILRISSSDVCLDGIWWLMQRHTQLAHRYNTAHRWSRVEFQSLASLPQDNHPPHHQNSMRLLGHRWFCRRIKLRHRKDEIPQEAG